MSTFKERMEKTRELILDDNVGFVEGFLHLINWVRFERAIAKRNKYAELAVELSKKLQTNMDVWTFRKELFKSE